MHDDSSNLRIVRLLEPDLCRSCQYGVMVLVEMEDGSDRRMLQCKRLDCDNWETEDVEDRPVIIRSAEG